jgi:peptide/nickel transport system substrate-binding protein
MRTPRKAWLAVAIATAAALTLAACSSSKSSSNPSSASGGASSSGSGSTQKSGGTIKVIGGVSPDSLDPGFGYTTQALEADNVVYTPLLNYVAKSGEAGTVLQPALAEALPTISADGLTYTMKLRSGLTYSDGSPVKASDFTFAIERSIKIQWGGSSFYTDNIVGADAYGKGTATTISGIKTDDTTGSIVITLVQAYGAFANLLAFPAAAPLPQTTAMSVLSNTPPVGIGPYKFSSVIPNAGYTLVKNPSFAGFKIPGIPTGFADEVDVTIDTNTTTEAQQVLNNTYDVFDPADAVPASVLADVTAQAKDRYTVVPIASSYYMFMNSTIAPFNNASVRQAVSMATDRTALAKLSSGQLIPGCFFLPPGIIGHNDGNCASGDPNVVPSDATVAKAKQMIADAGDAGMAVTVWSETRSPRQEFMAYYTDLLNKLGFKATLKVTADKVYFQTIGNLSLNAQTGFADWSQDFPNPSDFYLLLSKAGIQPTNNENFGQINDPKIESQLSTLLAVPATKLSGATSQWQALDKYVDQQAYTITYGYSTAPVFTSNRIDYKDAVFHSVNYMMFNTLSLK